MDHAGAALAGVTPYMSASFTKRFADEINKQGIVRHIRRDRFAVESETYIGHVANFPMSFFFHSMSYVMFNLSEN